MAERILLLDQDGNPNEMMLHENQIHLDDSIETIKKKLIHEIPNISYDEIYLFGYVEKTIRLDRIFHSVATDETIPSFKFSQIILHLNIDVSIVETLPKKAEYTLDDLLMTELDKKQHSIAISIGKQFAQKDDPLFSANPFDLIPNTEYLSAEDNPLISLDNQVLLNAGSLLENTLYICLAEDVFAFFERHNIPQNTIAYYFPQLFKQSMLDLPTLQMKKQDLIKKTKKAISKEFLRQSGVVSTFYNLYRANYTEIQAKVVYENIGIESFSLIMHPLVEQTLPIESIFKNVHATKEWPFIKYNPGPRRENIYRFYAEQITRTGIKIPFLGKNTIVNLYKEIGKNREISFYLPISPSQRHDKIELFVSIMSNGNIQINGEFEKGISIDALEEIIRDYANPVIKHINHFLFQSGFEIPLFQKIKGETIEIIHMKYSGVIPIEKAIDFPTWWGCLSIIYDNPDDTFNLEKGVHLRFKRVENYQEMEEDSTIIAELFKQTNKEREIVDTLIANFHISEEEAILKIAHFFDKFTRIQGKYVNKAMDVVENPGFPVEIRINSFESKLYFSVDRIISVEYIHCIQVYMDTFIYMTQFMKKTLKKMCEKPAIKLKPTTENVIIVEPVKTRVQPIQFKFQRELSEDPDEDNMKFIFDRDEDEMEEYNSTMSPIGSLSKDNSTMSPIGPRVEEPEPFAFDRDEKEENSSVDSTISPIGSTDKVGPKAPIEESQKGSQEESQEEGSTMSPIGSIDKVGPKASIEGSQKGSPDEPFMFDNDEDSYNTNSTDSTLSPIEKNKDKERKGGGPKKKNPNIEVLDEEEIPNYELEQYKKKIDDMPLTENNNNLFLNRLKKREPTLFLEKTEGNFDRYSRLCLSNYSRQPIILTDQEKERIDREHPGSYNHSVSYGTDPNKKFHYICPRYWCLLTQTSLTEEEVQASIAAEEKNPGSSKCGKIIPKNAKKVTKGHYIYEFDHPKQHRDNKTGKYVENTPGFLDASAHQNGFCLPCCFKKAWESKSQKTRREQCAQTADTAMVAPPPLQREYSYRTSHYIVGIDKMIVPQSRWGFLPFSAQYFLQTNNASATTTNNAAVIRPDAFPLLRYGVEQNPRQSFIGCIADAYATQRRLLQVPSIEEMGTILAENISIDQYIRLHNGSIVSIFKTKEKIDYDNYEKYRDSSLFVKDIIQSMNSSTESQESKEEFLIYTVASYENFLAFLKNPESTINHTFLWDILATSNPQLFPIGLNLVILEIVDVDNTENIQLVCPSISYSSAFYDEKKPTFILLKRDAFYEPIYTYTHNTDDRRELFLESSVPNSLKRTMQIIRKTAQKYCSPQPSMPDVYHLKRSHIASITRDLLQSHRYAIENQVVNYQGRTIGFILQDPHIMVPAYPSAPLAEMPIVFMDEDLWQDYETTRDALFAIYRKTNGDIPCKPIVKIEEDGLVVGILTETDQFVQIGAPAAPIQDGLRSINSTNYMTADKEFALDKPTDRENAVKRIHLEEQFYSAFRTMVKVLLQNRRQEYKDLMEIVENPNMRYRSKLRFVQEILQTISKESVNFVVNGKDIDFLAFNEITACREETQYCLMRNGILQIQIPKQHLFQKPDGSFADNETLYYRRLADELVRFKRIQSFMLESNNIRVPVTSYRVYSNEMIMLQSLLTSEYFASLIPYHQTENITFDMVNPRISQIYSNIITLDEQLKLIGKLQDNAVKIDCIKGEPQELEGNKQNFWRRLFPLHTQEYIYHNSPICTFYVLIDILMKINDGTQVMDVPSIKNLLIESYRTFAEQGFERAIADIWNAEGKKKLLGQSNGSFEMVIMSEAYYMTNLDLWVIADRLNLPIILFSTSKISSFFIRDDPTAFSVNWIAAESGVKERIKSPHFFIRGHSKRMKMGEIHSFSVITTPFILNNVKGIEGMVKSGLQNPDSEYRNNIIGLIDYLRMHSIS